MFVDHPSALTSKLENAAEVRNEGESQLLIEGGRETGRG